MTTPELQEELRSLAKLQFTQRECEHQLDLDDYTIEQDETLERAWERGIVEGQREVRQVLYDMATEGKKSQAVTEFLKLTRQFETEAENEPSQ